MINLKIIPDWIIFKILCFFSFFDDNVGGKNKINLYFVLLIKVYLFCLVCNAIKPGG